jgi:hypothetical protein
LQISSNYPIDKMWMTSEIRKEIRIRDRLRKKYIKNKIGTNERKYKNQRNKVNNLKKSSKLHLSELSNALASFWFGLRNGGYSEDCPSPLMSIFIVFQYFLQFVFFISDKDSFILT